MTLYAATINTPGYLPEGEPYLTEDAKSAWEYLKGELERDAEGVEDGGRSRNYGDALAMVEHCMADPDGPRTGIWAHDDSDPYDLGMVYSVDIYSGPCEWSEDCERLAETTRETVSMGGVPVCERHAERTPISSTLAASADAIARTERALGMFPAVDNIPINDGAPYGAQWGYPYSPISSTERAAGLS